MTAVTTIQFLDWCRLFLLAQAGFVGCAAVVIWVKYAIRSFREPTQPMLWHVIAISVSYFAAICYLAVSTVERFGQPLGWRLPLAGFVFISGDAGLCFMLTHLYSHRVYAKQVRERLIREEIIVTRANTKATEENTEAISQTTK